MGGKNVFILQKNKDFLVATNIIASRPPESRPTGMPTTHAKMGKVIDKNVVRTMYLKC